MNQETMRRREEFSGQELLSTVEPLRVVNMEMDSLKRSIRELDESILVGAEKLASRNNKLGSSYSFDDLSLYTQRLSKKRGYLNTELSYMVANQHILYQKAFNFLRGILLPVGQPRPILHIKALDSTGSTIITRYVAAGIEPGPNLVEGYYRGISKGGDLGIIGIDDSYYNIYLFDTQRGSGLEPQVEIEVLYPPVDTTTSI
jgi:hypothetical protein